MIFSDLDIDDQRYLLGYAEGRKQFRERDMRGCHDDASELYKMGGNDGYWDEKNRVS
jgi:hypothetical protein